MKKIKKFLVNNYAVALTAGAFCNLAFAPFYFFAAAIFSIATLYFLLEKPSNKKEIFYLGFFYGFGYFLAGVYWISISLLVDAQSFAWLIPFALTLIPAALGLYFGLFALSYKLLIKKFNFSKTHQKTLIFVILWLVFEVLRSFLFTGFPWNLIGYVWFFNNNFVQIANVFGIFGLSFFAVLVSLFPTLFFDFNGKKFKFKKPNLGNKIHATIIFIIVAAIFIYGHLRIDDRRIIADNSVKLRLIQANIKQDMKWDAKQKYDNLLKHINLTNSPNFSDKKIVIWSETSVPYAFDSNLELLEKLSDAMPNDSSLITGGLRVKYSELDQVSDVWNSVFALSKVGDKTFINDYYDKHHLVPFGEYVPLQKFLPFIDKITDGAIGFSQGMGPKTLKIDNFSFSPLLCYEAIFSDKIIDKKNRPDLLVNLTNDAWFGKSSGPYQHFDMTRMRAVEYGIPLARVANTGITAFVDPFGRVMEKIDLNEEGIIDVVLVRNLPPTIYSNCGFVPLILLVLLSFVLLIKKSKNKNAAR